MVVETDELAWRPVGACYWTMGVQRAMVVALDGDGKRELLASRQLSLRTRRERGQYGCHRTY